MGTFGGTSLARATVAYRQQAPRSQMPVMRSIAKWLIPVVFASGCVSSGDATKATSTGAALKYTTEPLWLDRVSYGVDTASVARYRALGRDKFLTEQLSGTDPALPPAVTSQIANMAISRMDGSSLLREATDETRQINTMPDGPDKEQARKSLADRGNLYANEAIRRELLRALYSPAQLQERMVSFWLNHFSVHQYKGQIRWLIGDYADHAIRPNALGHFGDLVLATLEHPAMLQYLDNAQNSVGHINENYARELLELHTLGVNGGYSQQDVQQLARVLTGVGINASTDAPKLPKSQQTLYVRRGAFEFNPARHDFGRKTLLGKEVPGVGMDEVTSAINIIVRSPTCAEFISRRMAMYFLGDSPPQELIRRMAITFQRTDGDISAVLAELLRSPQLQASLGHKFKDPREYILSVVRLAYDGQTLVSTRPLQNWLNALGEAPFGRATPDGYPLDERAWTSSGQLSRRFEIARAVANGNSGLFDPEDGSPASTTGFPKLSSRLYYEVVEPRLSTRTKTVLEQANSQQEWNTFLLSAPELNYH